MENILDSYRVAFLTITKEIEDSLDLFELTLTTGWVKSYSETFSLAACVELVYVLLIYRVQCLPSDNLSTSVHVKNDIDIRLKRLFSILRDVLSGTRRGNDKHEDDGEKTEGEKLNLSSALPGGLILGQQRISSNSIYFPSASLVFEILDMLETILIVSNKFTFDLCRELVYNILKSIKGKGDIVIERINIFLYLLSQIQNFSSDLSSFDSFEAFLLNPLLTKNINKNANINVNQIKQRKPLLSIISNKNKSEFSIFSSNIVEFSDEINENNINLSNDDNNDNNKNINNNNGMCNFSCVKTIEIITMIKNVFLNNLIKKFDNSNYIEDEVESPIINLNQSLLLNTNQKESKNSNYNNLWTQVSGSSDVLTILISSQQENELQPSVLTVRVNVTNTSGFKIPAFSIDIILLTFDQYSVACESNGYNNSNNSNDSNNNNYNNTNNNNNDNSNNNSCNNNNNYSNNNNNNNNSHFTNNCYSNNDKNIFGTAATILRSVNSGTTATIIDRNNMIEYILPNAMVEKIFYIEIKRFSSIDIVVRLSYPDLELEESDTGDSFFSCDKHSNLHIEGPAGLNISGGGRSEMITTTTDSSPYHIDVISFLKPYGNSTLNDMQRIENKLKYHNISNDPFIKKFSMKYEIETIENKQQKNIENDKISFNVFISLYDQLCHIGFLPYPDYSNPTDHSMKIENSVTREESYLSSLRSCQVSSPCYTSPIERAWAMETLWGSFIAVRVEGSKYDRRIAIRCSDAMTLSAILNDSSAFLRAL